MSNINDTKSIKTPITLRDGVERELLYTLNALAEMEDRNGSVEKTFEELDKNSIKAIRFVIWAGLLHNEAEALTEQQVGNLIDVQCLNDIVGTVAGALNANLPEEDNSGNVVALPNA